MSESETPTIWMRCPYDADLCGADAALTDFTADPVFDVGWSGTLECVNGHRFQLSQQVIEGVSG